MASALDFQVVAEQAKEMGISPIRGFLDAGFYGDPLLVIPPLEGAKDSGVKIESASFLDEIRNDLGAVVTTHVLYLGTFRRGGFSMEYLFPFETNDDGEFSLPSGKTLEISYGKDLERTLLAQLQFTMFSPQPIGSQLETVVPDPEKIAERAAKLIHELANR
jgi:hypothetical protein